MKFKVTFKDPDALHDQVRDAVDGTRPEGLDDEEWESIAETRAEKTRDEVGRWFRYGEYITVEVDTVAKTCVVVEDKS